MQTRRDFYVPQHHLSRSSDVLHVIQTVKLYSTLTDGLNPSLAAVCTGIAAGKYGLDSIPASLLEQTEGLERLESLGQKLYEKFFTAV